MNARGHLSYETLDLLALAALAEAESQAARAHLDACTSCKSAWTELEEDRARFTQFVFPRTLPKLEQRAQPAPFWERVRAKWTFAMPFAGLIAVTALAVIFVTPEQKEATYIGIKGGARLDVVALRGDRQISVGNDTALVAGDRIRFLVEPAGAQFVMVASKDGKGNVTVYYPYEGLLSAPLSGGFQELPGTIELDAVGGKEHLFAVFSDTPIRTEEVREALERNRDLSGVIGVRAVATKEFVKEAR